MDSQDAARREIIRQILELEAKRQSLAEESVKTSQTKLHDDACEQFGTWQVALEYAGVRLKRGVSQNYVPEVIIRRIRRRCAALYSVRSKYVRKADHRLYREAIGTFGSWKAALDAAGIQRQRLMYGAANPRLKPDQILELLRERAEAGESMKLVDFACDNQAVARAIVYHFKCWQNAVNAAGIQFDNESSDHVDSPPPEACDESDSDSTL